MTPKKRTLFRRNLENQTSSIEIFLRIFVIKTSLKDVIFVIKTSVCQFKIMLSIIPTSLISLEKKGTYKCTFLPNFIVQTIFCFSVLFIDINIFAGAVGSTHDSPLSKWFDKDVLQQIPSKGSSQIPSGKVLSVEELENKQR